MKRITSIVLGIGLVVALAACDIAYTPGGPAIGNSPSLIQTCEPATQTVAIREWVANSWSGVWNDTEYVMHGRSFGWNLHDDPIVGVELYDYTVDGDTLYLNPGVDPAIDPESTGDSFEVTVRFPYGWEGTQVDFWLEVGWIPVGGGAESNIDHHQYTVPIKDCTPSGLVSQAILRLT